MKRIKRKLRSAGGLTLVEMLCAVVILVLLCLMMNTGIQLAVNSYQDETAESETQLLLSTLTDALSDKLRYAVVTGDEGSLKSSLSEVGVNEDGRVTVDGQELLPAGVYRHGKYVAAKAEVEAKEDASGCYFTVALEVREASGGEHAISAETELTVRCLTPQKSSEEGTTP